MSTDGSDQSIDPAAADPGAQPVDPQSQVPGDSPSPAPPAAPPDDDAGGAVGGEPAAQPTLRDRALERGYDVTQFPDDSTLETALFDAADSYYSNQSLIQAGQRVAPHLTEFEKWREEQARTAATPATPAAEPAAAPTFEHNAPEFDGMWIQKCLHDDGTIRANADPVILQKLREYQSWRDGFQRNWESDPADLIRRAMAPKLHELEGKLSTASDKEELRKLVTEVAQQVYQERTVEQENSAWIASREKDLFQADANGHRKVDPATGQPLLTEMGHALRNHGEQLRGAGITDPRAIRELADRLLLADQLEGKFTAGGQTPPADAAPPAATPAEAGVVKRELFMRRALQKRKTDSRDGTHHREALSPEAPMQNPDLELGDLLERELVAQGIVQTTG